MGAALVLAGTAAVLGASALASGTAVPLPLLPSADMLGVSPVATAPAAAAVAPCPAGGSSTVFSVVSGAIWDLPSLVRAIRDRAVASVGAASGLMHDPQTHHTVAAATAARLAEGASKAQPARWRRALAEAAGFAGVAAVVLTSFVGHQNLSGAMSLLTPYTPARMTGAVTAALAVSAGLYLTLALGAALTFGPATQSDVLVNFSVDAMAPLLGGRAVAVAAALLVQGGYAICVMGAFALFIHPLRSSVAELLAGGGGGGEAAGADEDHVTGDPASAALPHLHGSALDAAEAGYDRATALSEAGTDGSVAIDDVTAADALRARSYGCSRAVALEAQYYHLITYGLLALCTAVAVLTPSIWQALATIGNVASSVQVSDRAGRACPVARIAAGARGTPHESTGAC
jgi:hypothetical protein